MSRAGQGLFGLGWRRVAGPRQVRRLRQDDSGAVAIITAITSLVVVVLAGAAIDMALYAERRSQITAAVDSALLAAVSSANQAEAAGRSLTEAASAGAAAAGTVYDVDTADIGSDVTHRDLSITVEKKTVSSVKKWVASATVDGSYSTYFMKIVGTHTLPLKVGAASTGAVNKAMDYWQYYIAVDVSQSMGIGTTVSDMKKMVAFDQSKCYFACHTGPNDRMAQMRKAGIDFRIDAVDRAVKAMISTMKSGKTGNAQAGIYGINWDLSEAVPITSDFDKLLNYTIDLPVWVWKGRALELKTSEGETNFRAAMASLTRLVPASGDGSSASSPKRSVFLITDGVHDSNGWEGNAEWASWDRLHYTGPMDPAYCKGLKNKGVLVAVLYITYYQPEGGDTAEVGAFRSRILPKLKACASSDNLFFNATDSDGIGAALQSMLKVVTESSRVRLTN